MYGKVISINLQMVNPHTHDRTWSALIKNKKVLLVFH